MKRITKWTTFAMSALLGLSGLAALANSPIKVGADHEIVGDLYGAAHISFKASATTPDVLATFELNVGGGGNSDYSGTGIYIRMKNYTSIDTPISFKINSTNATLIGPATNVDHTYYDASGNLTTGCSARPWGHYLMLPANFDGFIYMNYSSQMSKIEGSSDFNPANIYRCYFDISAMYDSYANFAIGDIFTDTKDVLDGSSLSETDFASTWILQSSGETYLNLEQLPTSDVYKPTGDLLGSGNVQAPNYGGFHIMANAANMSGDGFYVRMKNNSANDQWIACQVNSTNNARITNTPNASYTLYDADGELSLSGTINTAGIGYIYIPASFNGYLYMPWASFSANTGEDWSSEPFTVNSVYAVYFEGTIVSMDFGDLFTQDLYVFNGSEYYEADFGTHFVADWNCTLTINEGYKEPEVPEFDYSTVEFTSELEGGMNIACTKDSENNTIAVATITLPEILDFSDVLAITVRVKGLNGSYPFFFRVVDSGDNKSQLPSASSGNKVKFISRDSGAVSNANLGGNDHSVMYPAGIDGDFIVPIAVLESYTANPADLAAVAGFEIGIAVMYDFDFKAIFADIGYVVESDASYHLVLDCSANTFSSLFSVTAGSNFLSISKYFIPQPCSWIGDVKILNSLNYDSDEALKTEVTWNSGDNACTYHTQDDGMFVHIGPYETGHTYGSYMCLVMPELGVTTDRTQWFYTNDSDEQVLAKGLTMYVKNLSLKEIGITLQFDEVTTNGTLERWCLTGYPAMYYAWDVNTNAEYSFYSKSDQFQIPVGFEGYVRIPFESYRVPEWNQSTAGVDNVLDITKWSGVFYLTSDNTRYEDLEFFIKNIGVYFKDTQKGNMFNSSNTIKANMGL